MVCKIRSDSIKRKHSKSYKEEETVENHERLRPEGPGYIEEEEQQEE